MFLGAWNTTGSVQQYLSLGFLVVRHNYSQCRLRLIRWQLVDIIFTRFLRPVNIYYENPKVSNCLGKIDFVSQTSKKEVEFCIL